MEETAKIIPTLAMQTNGSALAISVVAASNLFGGEKYNSAFVIPASLFLVGMIFGYLLFAVFLKQEAHFQNQRTELRFRRTALDVERSEYKSEKMIEIAEDCIQRADALSKEMLSDEKLDNLRRAADWTNNISLGLFCAGVISALYILS